MNKQARFLPPTKTAADVYPLSPPSRGFQTYEASFLSNMPKYMAGSEEGMSVPKSPSPFGKVWQFHRALRGELGNERREESVSVFRGIVALLAARQYFALPVVVNVTPQLQAEGGSATLLQELFEPHVSCVPTSKPPSNSQHPKGPIMPFLWHSRMTYFALRKNDGHDAVFAGYSPLTLVYPASKTLPPDVARQIFWWDATEKRLTDPTRLPSSHSFYQEALKLRSVLKTWLSHTLGNLHSIPLAPDDIDDVSTILQDWQKELQKDPDQPDLKVPDQAGLKISELPAFETTGTRLQQLQQQVQETMPLPEFFRWVLPFGGGGLPMIKSRRTGKDTLVLTYDQARNPKTKIFGMIFGSTEVEKRLRDAQVLPCGDDLGSVLGVSAAVPYLILDKLFEPTLTNIYKDVNDEPPKVNESWKIITNSGEAYLFPFKRELLDYFTNEQVTAGTKLLNLGTGSLAIQFTHKEAVAHRSYKQEERSTMDPSMDLRLFPNFALDSLRHVKAMLPKEEDRHYYSRLRLFQGADAMWSMEWLNNDGLRIVNQKWEDEGNFERLNGVSSKGKQMLSVIKAGEEPGNRPAALHVKGYGLAFVKLKTLDFGNEPPLSWEIGLDFGTSNTCLVKRGMNQNRDDGSGELLHLGVFTTSLLDQWEIDRSRGSAAEGFSAIFDFPYLNNSFAEPSLGVSNTQLNPKDFFPTQVVYYNNRNAPEASDNFQVRNGLAFFQNITVTSLLANHVSELIKGFDSLKPANQSTQTPTPPERFILNRSLKWEEESDHYNPTNINRAWRKVFHSHLRLQILMSAAADNGRVGNLRASYPKAFTSSQKESYEKELKQVWGESVTTEIFSESAAAAKQLDVGEAQVAYLIDIGGGTADFAVYRDKGLIGECSLKLAGSFIENYFCSSHLFRKAIADKRSAHTEFNKLNKGRLTDFEACLKSPPPDDETPDAKKAKEEMFRTAFHGILNILPPRELVTDIIQLENNKACTGFTLTNVFLYSSLAYFAGLVQRDLRGSANHAAESKLLLHWVGNGSCFLKTLNRGEDKGSFQKVLQQLFVSASETTGTTVECDALGKAKSVVALGLLKLTSSSENKATNIASKIFSYSFSDAQANTAHNTPFGPESLLADFYKQDSVPNAPWDGVKEGGVFRNFLLSLQKLIPRFRLGDQSLGGLGQLGITKYDEWAVDYVESRKYNIGLKFQERLKANHRIWNGIAKHQPETLQVEPLFITEVAALLQDICEFCGVQK